MSASLWMIERERVQYEKASFTQVRNYLSENCIKCINELFSDKVTCQNNIFSFASGHSIANKRKYRILEKVSYLKLNF